MRDALAKKRTFLLCGHAQSGKTSVSEAILFKSGATRLGRVDDCSSVSDSEDDEKARKSSINLSVLNAEYKGNYLQFIDTPGYLDFIGELVSSAPIVDFAIIVVDAIEGVGVGTEKAWDILSRENIPCIFYINKLDKEGADYKKTLKDIQETLTKKAVSMVCEDNDKFVCILKNRDKDQTLYGQVVERVAESDDALIEKYLETGELGHDEVVDGLKVAISNAQIYPVFCGIATQGKGIEAMLDVVIDEMPSTADSKGKKATDKDDKEIIIEEKIDSPFSAQVLKTIVDPFVGQLTIFRVFSGKIASNGDFFNATKGSKEKFGQLYIMNGKQQIAQDELCVGDIGAVAKLKNTETQDTLCSSSRQIKFPTVEFPSPAYSASLKPKTRADEDKISGVLHRLTHEDPTCKTSRDSQTKELIISGMGELHLHIIVERMKRKYQVDVELGKPKVPYFETISKKVTVRHKYKKQSGGRGQYGDVSMIIEPLERGKQFEFINKITGGAIPRNFIPSVEKGVRQTMEQGSTAGFPLTDIKVTLFDGSYHDVDSSDIAFQIAASMALKKALEEAGSSLIEPIMDVEIVVPDELMGSITGDISGRRGRVLGMESKGRKEAVKAKIPLSEMFTYASDLRSVTAGRGNYTMSFSHYDIVPQRIAQGIIEKTKLTKVEH